MVLNDPNRFIAEPDWAADPDQTWFLVFIPTSSKFEPLFCVEETTSLPYTQWSSFVNNPKRGRSTCSLLLVHCSHQTCEKPAISFKRRNDPIGPDSISFVKSKGERKGMSREGKGKGKKKRKREAKLWQKHKRKSLIAQAGNLPHYKYVLVSGNGNSASQTLTYNRPRPFLRIFVVVFLDDILVCSSSRQRHLKHLDAVLTALKRAERFATVRVVTRLFSREVPQTHMHCQGGNISPYPEKLPFVREWPNQCLWRRAGSFKDSNDINNFCRFRRWRKRERARAGIEPIQRQRLASPTAQVFVAQTTRPVQKIRLCDEL